MKFAGVEITQETILLTRQHFADICHSCIVNAVEYDSIPADELQLGKFFVNDLLGYMTWENQKAIDFIEGKNDDTFTFLQRAVYIQTGEEIALLA